MSGSMEVLSEIRNHIAFITLNRPGALNALSLAMILELRDLLERCSAEPEVYAIVLQGAGDKAFCAGGDIRALYQSFKSSGSLHREFFAAEYPVDYLLYDYPKPYIALMDGITMGGGMGLAQGSRLRIVGERTRMAMPEVAIGFFPDVGGSYFLSRLPGKLGLYLALTGIQIRGADAVYCGLADFHLPPPAIAGLHDRLEALSWSADHDADIRRCIAAADAPTLATPALAAPALAAPALPPLRTAIDTHFSKASARAIIESLEGETRPEFAEWARQTATLMRSRSPTMLSVTLRQLERGAVMGLADCFRMELGMAAHSFIQGDFVEGIRAVLIDKDNAPRWRPGRIEEVADASVDAFFQRA
ncbi:MAG TPA: enoyl-CoA hydratase/isomerase family protein [Steroidobacteraceae bacterium]|nr:enoyl-CoA hydratase/isomerase family protein [Steroidobacteraceae bacterium]